MLLLKVDNRISADHIEFQQVLSSFESYYERGKGFKNDGGFCENRSVKH